jgi:hypothetical protein
MDILIIIIIIMALFNITNKGKIVETRKFMTSNMNIHIDTMNLKISELQITEDQWSGIF